MEAETRKQVAEQAAAKLKQQAVILLLDGELVQPRLEGLGASLATRFARGVADRGGHAAVDCQDVRPVRPGTEGALASYCFKGTTMRWSTEGSRTPMAISLRSGIDGRGLRTLGGIQRRRFSRPARAGHHL